MHLKIRPGNLKSTRIGHVKVGNISFLPRVKILRLKLKACGCSVCVDWRRYWLNRKESNWHLHHICEKFKAFSSFPKLIVGMLVIIIFSFFEKVKDSSAFKIENPFHQCRVDLEVLESKIISSPFTTQQRGHWGSYFCQYRRAVLWMIFYCFANDLLYGCNTLYYYKSERSLLFFSQQYGKCDPPPQRLVGQQQ